MKKLFALLILIATLTSSVPLHGAEDDLEYFKQFIYRVETDDSDPDFPTSSHHFVMTQWDYNIPISATQYLTQTFTVYMLENFTYKAYFRENLHTVGQDWFTPKGCRILEGTWSVPDQKLIFIFNGKPLIEADRYSEEGQHAMLFHFLEGIIGPEVKGHKIPAGAAQGSGIDDHFCF